jgi:hypothetical protein
VVDLAIDGKWFRRINFGSKLILSALFFLVAELAGLYKAMTNSVEEQIDHERMPTLFKTSLFISALHFAAWLWMVYDRASEPVRLLSLMYVVGCATSIWNHWPTLVLQDVAKYTDRGAMAIGFFVDLFHIFTALESSTQYIAMAMQVLTVGNYFSAKAFNDKTGTYAHAVSHFCIGAVHCYLLMNIAEGRIYAQRYF